MAIDLGFYMTATVRVRVLGCDTPERGHPLHDKAWARSRELAAEGSTLVVTTQREADKYGRWLASIACTISGKPTDVSTVLIAEGLAHPYDGGTKMAW